MRRTSPNQFVEVRAERLEGAPLGGCGPRRSHVPASETAKSISRSALDWPLAAFVGIADGRRFRLAAKLQCLIPALHGRWGEGFRTLIGIEPHKIVTAQEFRPAHKIERRFGNDFLVACNTKQLQIWLGRQPIARIAVGGSPGFELGRSLSSTLRILGGEGEGVAESIPEFDGNFDAVWAVPGQR